MSKLEFFPHQVQALNDTKEFNRVAYYHDMGLGKTYTGAEKMYRLGAKVNLIICQKSKVNDWFDHFRTYYWDKGVTGYDLTKKQDLEVFITNGEIQVLNRAVGIINYELTYRRPELKQLKNYTLMLDESSLIQNPSTQRSKFVLQSKPDNIILLSGTPTAGKYEKLLSQIHLLGWNISKDLFWKHYVEWEWVETDEGFFRKSILGYKNVDRLKMKLRQHGAMFLKSEEVPEIELPSKVINKVLISTTKEYRKFQKSRIIKTPDGKELIGDCAFTKRLYSRMLCGHHNKEKLQAVRDLINSTDDRLIVFYNFNDELTELKKIAIYFERPFSIINGESKDLTDYDNHDNSITFVQYQAGALGQNLQKANKMIFFTLPESCEFFMQSPKRIHRIGQQNDRCFYYYLICKDSVEEHMLESLERGVDYTDELFKKYEEAYAT